MTMQEGSGKVLGDLIEIENDWTVEMADEIYKESKMALEVHDGKYGRVICEE